MVFTEAFNFSFFSVTGWGIDLDYCDIEWFALDSTGSCDGTHSAGSCNDAHNMMERSYPMVRGQGQKLRGATPCLRLGRQPRVLDCDSTGTSKRSFPMSVARGGGWEEQHHVQEAVALQAQESIEELFHVQGQEGRW